MKVFIAALMVASLGGCITLPDKVQLPAGQALLVAEAGVDGANHAATIAATTGVLKGENARKVHATVDAANNAISAAHTLYTSGNIAGTVTQLNIALKDIADIQAASSPKAVTQ